MNVLEVETSVLLCIKRGDARSEVTGVSDSVHTHYSAHTGRRSRKSYVYVLLLSSLSPLLQSLWPRPRPLPTTKTHSRNSYTREQGSRCVPCDDVRWWSSEDQDVRARHTCAGHTGGRLRVRDAPACARASLTSPRSLPPCSTTSSTSPVRDLTGSDHPHV